MTQTHGVEQDGHRIDEQAETRQRFISGDVFLSAAADEIPAVWGDGHRVAWASGESLIIAGGPGVGKTTVGAQLVRARITGGSVLDMPVTPGRRVLYLAMDRPSQIARALRRNLGDVPDETLRDRLTFWKGPPLADVARHPETLIGLAQLADADTIVVDSLKDAAIKLSEDETGAAYNRARQYCTANGVEVLELHHSVKRIEGRPQLADLYGSQWIAAGAGSVIFLGGVAGDPIVNLWHVKTPAEEVGPYKVMHDHTRGTSHIWHATDLLVMAQAAGARGLTAKVVARSLFQTPKPTSAEVERARRRLDALVSAGKLTLTPGDKATAKAATYTFTETFTDPFTAPSQAVTLHDDPDPSRVDESEHDETFTDTFTTITPPHLHASPPLFKEGEVGGEDDEPDECPTCHRFTCNGDHDTEEAS